MGIFISFLAMPMALQASGMGIYVPYSFGDKSSLTDDGNDFDVEYKGTAGFGLLYDSNLGKDTLYNYRLGLEYLTPSTHKTSNDYGDFECQSECDFSRFNIVNTFGFGVFRTEMLRIWIGPRLNIAYMWDSGPHGYQEAAFEFGIAPAAGINVNIGPVVSLGFDLDYRFASIFGGYTGDDGFGGTDDGSYSGGTTGVTARFSLMFRFGETFERTDSTYNDL